MRQETDAAGQVLAARSFDPYGVPLSGDGEAPFGFTGEFHDNASGLLFLRARYLQVADGRFITRDTWPGDETSPITFNAWAYGGANPVKFTDRSGHKACEDQQCAIFEAPRGQLRAAYGGALYALIGQILAESGSAGDVLGNVMQSTSGMLFSETCVPGVSQGAGAVFRGHFTGIASLRGDTGFAPELGDEHWYRRWWGEKPNPRSLQLGHFLSAVDIAMNDGAFNTALMFTHEQYADTNPTAQTLNALGATLGLDSGTFAADRSAFSAAILADSAGASGARDVALWSILRPSSLGSLAVRQGNSVEDLRLNVRAYELVAALRSGALTTNQDLGIWIAGNIGVSR